MHKPGLSLIKTIFLMTKDTFVKEICGEFQVFATYIAVFIKEYFCKSNRFSLILSYTEQTKIFFDV